MKEKRDKWIEQFRHRMKDYSEPVPDGLWEQLDAELNKPKVIPFYTRLRVVAAVALLLLVSSLTVWFLHTPSAEYAETIPIPVSHKMDAVSPSLRNEPDRLVAPTTPLNTTLILPKQILAMASSDIVTEQPEPELPDEEVQQTEETSSATSPEQPQITPLTPQRRKRDSGYSFVASPIKHDIARWEVGVSMGNVSGSSSRSMSGYSSFTGVHTQNAVLASNIAGQYSIDEILEDSYLASPVNGKNAAYVLNQIYSNNVRETVASDVKHKMPVTVGASFRYHINDKWSVETGLTYTLLSSEMRSGTENYYYETEQQLHYIGVPLKANYQIWENNRFSVYASAGGAVEKCVSGKNKTVYITDNESNMSETEDLKVSPLQWSMTSAVGVQFKLSKQIGVYAEPGVAYFFDDGSEVETIRKEHPFNFNLQLGVRFSY